MDGVRHGGEHRHPGGAGSQPALAGPVAVGLLLPDRPPDHDPVQPSDAAASPHPTTLGPGLPARHGTTAQGVDE